MDKLARSLVALFALLAAHGAWAFTVTLFPGSTYNADSAVMDAALGITGATIENFEDATLIPGLTIEYTNPNATITTLPHLYTDGTLYNNNAWDGTHAVLNTTDNVEWNQEGDANLASRITFDVGAAAFFGIGLANFEGVVDHALIVNGTTVVNVLDDLQGFQAGINVRNGYLVIHADAGEVIETVGFELHKIGTSTPVNGAFGDGLVFDHLAVAPVPLPAAGWLLMSGLALVFGARGRNGRAVA